MLNAFTLRLYVHLKFYLPFVPMKQSTYIGGLCHNCNREVVARIPIDSGTGDSKYVCCTCEELRHMKRWYEYHHDYFSKTEMVFKHQLDEIFVNNVLRLWVLRRIQRPFFLIWRDIARANQQEQWRKEKVAARLKSISNHF